MLYIISFKKIQVCLSAFLITLLLQLAPTLNSFAQNIPYNIKNQFITTGRQTLEDTITEQTAIDYPFILGRNQDYVVNKINHPYFNDNECVNGTLVFKGKTYSAEGLKYDIESDKLILLKYSPNYEMNSIALDENFVSEFCIQNSTFRYYKGLENTMGHKAKEGYYEVVYDGNLKFLVRWSKSKSLDDNSTFLKYNVTSEMFLLKNDKIIRVKTMTKLISLLKDKKKDLKRYVRDNYLKLNTYDYSSASKVLNFYERLEKQ